MKQINIVIYVQYNFKKTNTTLLLDIHLSIYPPVYLSTCLSVNLSICLLYCGAILLPVKEAV